MFFLEYRVVPVDAPLDPISLVVYPLFHTEREEWLILAVAPIEMHVLPPDCADLHPGLIMHRKTKGAYRLNGTAFDGSTGEHGVWYSSLGPPTPDGRGPNYFRPLRTADEKGYLDLVNRETRFERLTFETISSHAKIGR